jgi:hypothetical protein
VFCHAPHYAAPGVLVTMPLPGRIQKSCPAFDLDGEMTLRENIADLGGLMLAYAGYQVSGANESFTGSFGPDAQFFFAYAQIWCANYRDEVARSSVRTDVHAAPRFRVNGAVTNMPEFAVAFACAPGHPWHPKTAARSGRGSNGAALCAGFVTRSSLSKRRGTLVRGSRSRAPW